MKQIIITLYTIVYCTCLAAQTSGTIKYSQTVKFDIQGIEGMDLGDMVPTEMSSLKSLDFGNNISVYQDAEEHVAEDIEIESEDGGFQIKIGQSEEEDILYTSINDNISLHQTSFMGKDFLVEEKLEKPKWKITTERIKYLGYVCQKATMVETINPSPGAPDDEGPTERNVVAWFTTEIPASIGPSNYNQLPGAILMVSVDEGKTEIKATEVTLQEIDEEKLATPTKGERMNNAEYEEVMAKKLEEMAKEYGGRGNTIMIRG